MCISFLVPLNAAGFGVNTKEELPLLVGPVDRGHYNITARFQLHLPPHTPDAPVFSGASDWPIVGEKLLI